MKNDGGDRLTSWGEGGGGEGIISWFLNYTNTAAILTPLLTPTFRETPGRPCCRQALLFSNSFLLQRLKHWRHGSAISQFTTLSAVKHPTEAATLYKRHWLLRWEGGGGVRQTHSHTTGSTVWRHTGTHTHTQAWLLLLLGSGTDVVFFFGGGGYVYA